MSKEEKDKSDEKLQNVISRNIGRVTINGHNYSLKIDSKVNSLYFCTNQKSESNIWKLIKFWSSLKPRYERSFQSASYSFSVRCCWVSVTLILKAIQKCIICIKMFTTVCYKRWNIVRISCEQDRTQYWTLWNTFDKSIVSKVTSCHLRDRYLNSKSLNW